MIVVGPKIRAIRGPPVHLLNPICDIYMTATGAPVAVLGVVNSLKCHFLLLFQPFSGRSSLIILLSCLVGLVIYPYIF